MGWTLDGTITHLERGGHAPVRLQPRGGDRAARLPHPVRAASRRRWTRSSAACGQGEAGPALRIGPAHEGRPAARRLGGPLAREGPSRARGGRFRDLPGRHRPQAGAPGPGGARRAARTSSWPSSATSCATRWPRCAPPSRSCAAAPRTRSTSGPPVEVLERQVAHMTSLVDQLLDVSRISSGKIVLHPEPIDLVEVARTSAEDQRGLIEESGLKLELKLHRSPLWVSGDPMRLAQVVSNLLANAAKFTDAGGTVTVAVQPRRPPRCGGAHGAGHGHRDRSRDAGPAVPALHRRRAAPRAGRAAASAWAWPWCTRSWSSHGGTVEARSEGRGRARSSWCASLSWPPRASPRVRPLLSPQRTARSYRDPARRGQPRRGGEPAHPPGARRDTRCEVAGDGPAALALARSFQPEVVLCDIGLPGEMDGYAVAAALCQGEDGRPYLIALSGYGQPADRERARKAGFDRHLTKPADPSALRRLLADLGRRA